MPANHGYPSHALPPPPHDRFEALYFCTPIFKIWPSIKIVNQRYWNNWFTYQNCTRIQPQLQGSVKGQLDTGHAVRTATTSDGRLHPSDTDLDAFYCTCSEILRFSQIFLLHVALISTTSASHFSFRCFNSLDIWKGAKISKNILAKCLHHILHKHDLNAIDN